MLLCSQLPLVNFKAHSIHISTTMRIECASNPVCRVHMKSDVHHIQSTSGGGLEVDSNWIVLLFMIPCWVVPTVGFLACLLAWLVARVVSVLLLQECWGRKRLVL